MVNDACHRRIESIGMGFIGQGKRTPTVDRGDGYSKGKLGKGLLKRLAGVANLRQISLLR